MKKINVLYISHSSQVDGAPKSLVEMMMGLRDVVNPTVVLPNKGKLEELLLKEGFHYIIVPFFNAWVSKDGADDEHMRSIIKDNFKAAYQLVDYVKDNDIDLIHSNSSVVDVGILTAIICNKPHIWHFREYGEEDFTRSYFDITMKSQLFKCSDQNIAITKALGKSYENKYGAQSVPLYDGIVLSKYEQTNENMTGNRVPVKLLLVGSISEGKGQFEAVKAVEYLVRNGGHDIKLIIVGNGDQNYIELLKIYVIKNKLQEYIEIRSYVDDLSQLRSECDFAIVCSKCEALGRVTIEAMLAELPVIGADTGGTKELIGENEERGYLYSQGSYCSLAESILRAGADLDGVRKRKTVAKKFAIEEFNIDNYSEKMLEVYHKTVNSFDDSKKGEKETVFRELLDKYGTSMERDGHNASEILLHTKSRKPLIDEFAKRWEGLKEDGYRLCTTLEEKGFRSAAIYGLGKLGWDLMREILLESKLELKYIIDKTPKGLGDILLQFKPEDELPHVDVIIITVLGEEKTIIDMLQAKIATRFYTLKELLE